MHIDRRVWGVAMVSVGLGLVAYAFWSHETDEEKIQRRLGDLTELLRVEEPNENVVIRTLRIRQGLTELCEPTVQAQIPELGSLQRGPEGLAAVAARGIRHFDQLEVTLDSVKVKVEQPQRQARASAVARLLGLRPGHHVERDERPVDFQFVHNDQYGWRIQRIDVGTQEGARRR
ncbi:hypothetical protein ACFL5O_04010 [Myxococcota bacterium]